MNKFSSYNSTYILKTKSIHDSKAITSNNMQFNTYAYNSFRNCILGNTMYSDDLAFPMVPILSFFFILEQLINSGIKE